MNERIKRLAEETEEHPYALHTIDLEKFAQSIVRECANYINDRTRDWDAELRWIFNDGSGDMAVDVDNLLNRHFGLEE